MEMSQSLPSALGFSKVIEMSYCCCRRGSTLLLGSSALCGKLEGQVQKQTSVEEFKDIWGSLCIFLN